MKNVHKDCKYYREERDVCLNYAMGKYHGLTYDISKKDKCISELIKPNKLSACPSNMVAFLMHKGLIKEKLISWVKGIDEIVRWVIIVPCIGLI